MGTPEDELKARMMAETETVIEQMLKRKKAAEEITLTEIEDLVIEARQEIEKRLTQMLIDGCSEQQAVPGPTCPECGKEMHYKGEREKRVMTQTGEVRISRPYYYCEACKRGIFPPG
jgi:uncharacterized protein with PIN domain